MSAALATGVTPAPVAAVQAHQPSASAAAQTSRAGNARQWVQYPFVAGGSRASVLGTITQADLNDMVTRQWQTLDDLARDLRRLEDRLSRLEEDRDRGQAPPDSPPPHY